MAATYPTSPRTFTSKTNHIDVYDASHIDLLQDEVNAIETYVGTNPHGTRGSLTARLALMFDTNGGFYGSAAFPAAPFARQGIFRNDVNIFYIRDSANTSWVSLGGSLSNVLFQYSAQIHATNYSDGYWAGEIIATSLLGSITATSLYRFLKHITSGSDVGVAGTVWKSFWLKTPGVNTINGVADVWLNSSSGNYKAKYQLTVGGVVATGIGTINMTAPERVKTTNIDVSGLTNGTVYEVIAELIATNGSGGPAPAYMGNLHGYGS